MIQWSALSPTAPKIRVRIPLATKCLLLCEKTKINEKEAGVGPLKNRLILNVSVSVERSFPSPGEVIRFVSKKLLIENEF